MIIASAILSDQQVTLVLQLGKVFTSPTTWYELVRLHKWRRPRLRVHPSKPKDGIRSSAPNEIWHVDTTLIRLLDGTRAYLHAIIDNFSRRILAWKMSLAFNPSVTAELLLNAAKKAARQCRMKVNRATSCLTCKPLELIAS